MSKALNQKITITKPNCTEQNWKKIIIGYLFLFLIIGFFMQPTHLLIDNMMSIIGSSGVLVTDYFVIASPGAAFFNGAITALIGCLILIVSGVPFTGLPIAAIFTVFGFSMFGKNMISVLPILLGSFAFALSTKQPYKNVACAALFATCLAPLGAYVAFDMGLGIPMGFVSSFIAGFLVPAFSKKFAQFHEGYNLYNIGFTAGITGMLILAVFRAFGYNSTAIMIWGEQFNPLMRIVCLPIFLSMCLLGWWLRSKESYHTLLTDSGVSPSDFVSKYGYGSVLINMGLMGLLGMLYIEVAAAHYNGATVGGLFTLVGFAAFGKHPKNSFPIMLGIYLAALVFPTTSPSAPGAMLAALYGTTLAPIAGRFGILPGVLAGVCHLAIVTQVGVLHGGLNLYNNGFSGGFVAIIFISIYHAFEHIKNK